jgi:hypothetical protein
VSFIKTSKDEGRKSDVHANWLSVMEDFKQTRNFSTDFSKNCCTKAVQRWADLFLAKSWTDRYDEANSGLSHAKAPKREIKYRNTPLFYGLIEFFSEIFVFK